MMSALPARRRARLGGAWAAAAVLALSGCSSSPAADDPAPSAPAAASAGRVIRAASLTAGEPIAAPAEKPVFTISGRIGVHNSGDNLVLDLSTLEKLGLRQVRLYEPWVKQDLEFQGVWLQDLLTVAQVDPGATSLHIVALDDYAVDLRLADVRTGGIMIATRAGDGSALPIDDGGPTRVVFLDGVAAGVSPEQWVWSIKQIDVV